MTGYIYQIINKVDGRRYVGQTINLEKRKRTHFSELRANKHPNQLLQKAWNTWGEENFAFEYEEIEISDSNTLNQAEIDTIARYNSFHDGYNQTIGGQGGVTCRRLSYEDYCFIYYGCQWQGMTEIIARHFKIDSSTISAIFREKSYIDFLVKSKELTTQEISDIQKQFREVFNIPNDKQPDLNRTPVHITEEEYFFCFCVGSTYGRGIEIAMSRYFNKHKSFLSNGLKGKKTGKVVSAYQKFLKLTPEEAEQIGEQKFKEWKLNKYSNISLKRETNNKWRN